MVMMFRSLYRRTRKHAQGAIRSFVRIPPWAIWILAFLAPVKKMPPSVSGSPARPGGASRAVGSGRDPEPAAGEATRGRQPCPARGPICRMGAAGLRRGRLTEGRGGEPRNRSRIFINCGDRTRP
jgi:hypothetical protein